MPSKGQTEHKKENRYRKKVVVIGPKNRRYQKTKAKSDRRKNRQTYPVNFGITNKKPNVGSGRANVETLFRINLHDTDVE